MNTPLWTDEYISIAIEDSGITDEDWLPVELMLKAMRDEYEKALVTRKGVPVGAIRRLIAFADEWGSIGDTEGMPNLWIEIGEARAWLDAQPQPGQE